MGIMLRKYPLRFKSLVFTCVLSLMLMANLPTLAEDLNIPVERTIATQPITKLEIIAIIKSLLNGRILDVKKQSSYTNPDCHHVKLLEDEGEFQLIKLGCHVENMVQISP